MKSDIKVGCESVPRLYHTMIQCWYWIIPVCYFHLNFCAWINFCRDQFLYRPVSVGTMIVYIQISHLMELVWDGGRLLLSNVDIKLLIIMTRSSDDTNWRDASSCCHYMLILISLTGSSERMYIGQQCLNIMPQSFELNCSIKWFLGHHFTLSPPSNFLE